MEYRCALPATRAEINKKIRAYEDLTGAPPLVRIGGATFASSGDVDTLGHPVFLTNSTAVVLSVGAVWMKAKLSSGEIVRLRPYPNETPFLLLCNAEGK